MPSHASLRFGPVTWIVSGPASSALAWRCLHQTGVTGGIRPVSFGFESSGRLRSRLAFPAMIRMHDGIVRPSWHNAPVVLVVLHNAERCPTMWKFLPGA